jgi:DNA-binding response OmpR family regulator
VSIRVLVVDDDDQIRRALASSLARAGFTVTSADDGIGAIELSSTMQFDSVIVDFNLKTMTGDAVVRHYKAKFGTRVYCAVLSGEDDDTTRDLCIAAGADDIFLKPASPRHLRERLTEAVAELTRAA